MRVMAEVKGSDQKGRELGEVMRLGNKLLPYCMHSMPSTRRSGSLRPTGKCVYQPGPLSHTCPEKDGHHSQGRGAHGGTRAAAQWSEVKQHATRFSSSTARAMVSCPRPRPRAAATLHCQVAQLPSPSRGGDQGRQQQQGDDRQHGAAVTAVLGQQALGLRSIGLHKKVQLSGARACSWPRATARVRALSQQCARHGALLDRRCLAASHLVPSASPCPLPPASLQSPPGRQPSCLGGSAGGRGSGIANTHRGHGSQGAWPHAGRPLHRTSMSSAQPHPPLMEAAGDDGQTSTSSTQPFPAAFEGVLGLPKQLAMMARSWMVCANRPSRSRTRSLRGAGKAE